MAKRWNSHKNRSKQTDKVLIVISSLQRGGAESQAILWAKYLKDNGLSVHVISLLPGALKDALEKLSIPFSILGKSPRNRLARVWLFVATLISLNFHVNQIRPKNVIAFLYVESLQLSILTMLKRKPFSLYLGRRADFGYGGRGFLQDKMLWVGYQKASAVFTNSLTNIKTAINDGVSVEKVKIIENYLRPDLLELEPATYPQIKRINAIHFLSVGNLSLVKNHALAIEVIRSFEQEHLGSKVTLDIYGEGLLRSDLERQIGESKSFSLQGNITNPWVNTEKYDIYIHTSLSEGSSNALWEAAAMGLPIISTKVGDLDNLRRLAPGTVFVAESKEEFLREISWIVARLDSVRKQASINAIHIRRAKEPRLITETIMKMLGSA